MYSEALYSFITIVLTFYQNFEMFYSAVSLRIKSLVNNLKPFLKQELFYHGAPVRASSYNSLGPKIFTNILFLPPSLFSTFYFTSKTRMVKNNFKIDVIGFWGTILSSVLSPIWASQCGALPSSFKPGSVLSFRIALGHHSRF